MIAFEDRSLIEDLDFVGFCVFGSLYVHSISGYWHIIYDTTTFERDECV